MKLLAYKSLELFHVTRSPHLRRIVDRPGVRTFASMFTFFGANVSFGDRTGTITTPVDLTILDECRLPPFERTTERYDDLCLRRARGLLDRASASGRQLALTYSGGIDSSLCLVSLLQAATPAERSRLVLLMNKSSIVEHQSLYDRHIRGRLELVPTERFPALLGDRRYVLVTGEGNDQLFGSAVLERLIRHFGPELLGWAATRDNVVRCFDAVLDDRAASERVVDVLQLVVAAAPVPIDTVHQWFWWINFTCKWQCVYTRVLFYTRPKSRALVDRAYVGDGYEMFFSPPSFQQWSMSNADRLIGREWRTYKQVCKDVIHAFSPDETYRVEKTKKPSLMHPTSVKPSAVAIDDGFGFHDALDPDQILRAANSFAEA